MKIVEQLIKDSLQELQNIACENESASASGKQQSKLIFPMYGKHTKNSESKRISEQESRFLFVRELEKSKNADYYYSVETPTELSYKFSDKKIKNYEPQIISVKDGGQSASVDVTLYKKGVNKFDREHLIEFKQGNVNTCKKDFLKLLYDMDGLYNYYVNIVDRVDLSKKNTFDSITEKYQKAINELKEKNKGLRNSNSILKIILFNINDGDMRVFKDINIKTDNTKVEEEKG